MSIAVKFGLSLLLLAGACGEGKKPDIRLDLRLKNNTLKQGEIFNVQLKGVDAQKIKGFELYKGDEPLEVNDGVVSTEGWRLGKRPIMAVVETEGRVDTLSETLTLLASKTPVLLKYNLLHTYPHDIKAYTQGLEFSGDTLYESTGQYGKSSLRKLDFKTGKIWEIKNIERKYFAEGITLYQDKIYQLTWREKIGFVYDKADFKLEKTFAFSHSAEGWGLCTDGKYFYKSDGTEKIWRLDLQTLEELDFVEVYTDTRAIESVNELEWVDGKIYANIYQRDALAVINPADGTVEAVLDLSKLKTQVTAHEQLDVLNGIAYHKGRGTFFVTGKNWDKLFEIEILQP